MGSNSLQNVLGRLGNAKRTAAGWSARCPAHEDAHASLCIAEDAGKVLLKCQAGCETAAVVRAIGLELRDLFPRRERSGAAGAGRKREIVATYDYVDAAGRLLFQTVRFKPKDFRQRRPDGPPEADGSQRWTWSLGDAPRVLYRLPELLAAPADAWIFLVEGEKDADNVRGLGLVATTSPMGAGKFGQVDSSPLHGRRICIIPDADAPGAKHADQVRAALAGRAAVVKLIDVSASGKDASDWIRAGGTAEALIELAEAAPIGGPPSAPASPAGSSTLPARRTRPILSNVQLNGAGGPRLHRPVADVADEVRAILGGWPRRLAGELFVPRGQVNGLELAGESEPVRRLDSPDQLFAAISSAADVYWKDGSTADRDGSKLTAVRRSELFEHLRATAEPNYRAVELLPHAPAVDGIFYPDLKLPEPTGLALAEFTAHLNADSEPDRAILESMLLTLGWGGPPGTRPAFVITSNHGKGAGKTQTAERILQAWGGRISVSPEGRGVELWERVRQRILSDSGATARGVLIDNVRGRIGGSDLESFITAPVIDGHALYHGHRSIPNLKTFILTMNVPQLGADLAPRSVVARIGRPRFEDEWETWVNQWLPRNRLQLIADVIGRLAGPALCEIPVRLFDRWSTWQRAVLSRVKLGVEAAELIADRRSEVNADVDEAAEIRLAIVEDLIARGHDPEIEIVWIRRADMVELLIARGLESRRASIRSVTGKLIEAIQAGTIPELADGRPGREGIRAWCWTGASAPAGQGATWAIEWSKSGGRATARRESSDDQLGYTNDTNTPF